MNLVDAKVWYLSKTLWVNILGGIVLLLDYLGTIGIEEAWIAAALALANFIIRFLTSQPLAATKDQMKESG